MKVLKLSLHLSSDSQAEKQCFTWDQYNNNNNVSFQSGYGLSGMLVSSSSGVYGSGCCIMTSVEYFILKKV